MLNATRSIKVTPEEAPVVEELLTELRRLCNHRGGPASVSLVVRAGKQGILSREVQVTRRTETTKREPD
jgi:hypothetical protein